MHGGGPTVTAGTPLPHEYLKENLDLVKAGCDSNLKKQIGNCTKFGVPLWYVSINSPLIPKTSWRWLSAEYALAHGAHSAAIATHWSKGGAGAVPLAKAVVKATSGPPKGFKFLYPLSMPLEEKINIIAREIYGAKGVE
ncbi:hypothetical protein OESDEN_18986, partial [Oesophagostomum dentatum]